MPNYVKNVLTFTNLTEEEKDFILERFTKVNRDDGSKTFDFNSVVPEPKTKKECPAKYILPKDKQPIEKEADRPWFDWYEWHKTFWGTKWEACDGYTAVNSDSVIFTFTTAWNAPFPIYEELSVKYNFNFNVKYADEDLGANCGEILFTFNKETGLKDFHTTDEEDYADPHKFAEDVWDNY